MKYGTRTQVLRQPTERVFHEAKSIGFDGLEFDLSRDYTQDILWSAPGRQRLLVLAEQTGVEVASVCLGALWGNTFASDDEEARRHAERIITEAARFTPELGTRVILVPIAGVEGQDPELGRRRWIEGLRPCAQVAEQTGAILALENVGRSPARSAELILSMIEAVGSPALQVYYDVGNATAFGYDPTAELRLLGQRVAQVHIKGAGSAQLFEHKLDLPGVARTLREIGYDGYLVFETRATETPSETVRRNLAILRQEVEAAYGAA